MTVLCHLRGMEGGSSHKATIKLNSGLYIIRIHESYILVSPEVEKVVFSHFTTEELQSGISLYLGFYFRTFVVIQETQFTVAFKQV